MSFATLVESDAWKNAQTFQQRVALCQIPDEVLPKLSTAQLVDLCVSNPLNGIINAYDNPMTGVHYVTSHFNGFRELKRRADAESHLIDFYESINFRKVLHSPYLISFSAKDGKSYGLSGISFLELVLSSNEFPKLVSDASFRQRLLTASLKSYETRLAQPETFSAATLSKPIMILCRITLLSDNMSKSKTQLIKKFYDSGGSGIKLRTVSEILFSK